MVPKRVAVKSTAGDSAKRLKLHDSKKKPADQSVEDSLLASDEPDAETDGDDMKKNAEPASEAIVPFKTQHQDTPSELTDGLVAVKTEQDDKR